MKILKRILRITKYIFVIVVVLLFALILILFSPALWRHWITYPQLEKARTAWWAERKVPEQYIQMMENKGVLHAHTYWSHDSRGTLPEILEAAKAAELDFIFFSDHAHGKLDTFPRSYHGVFDGIIMEAGTESSNGLMVNPFDSVVLDWNKEMPELIEQVTGNNGFVAYVHTEKEHPWDNPHYQAMEIYNVHTDILDESSILPIVINNTVNGGKYMHWCFREFYDDQTAILANWDNLNKTRRIVGIGAADAHNNQSFRARYTDDGQVEWVGSNAKTISIKNPGLLDKILLGEPDKNGWAFRWELDPYFASFNAINNHVYCDTFSNVNIKENIIKGHLFIAFENLGNADGFQYFSMDKLDKLTAIPGDSVSVAGAVTLKAVSPLPVVFRLYDSGVLIEESQRGYEYEYKCAGRPGNYRVVAVTELNGRITPWIFSNPIYVY
ncbi:MAG: hypothetical protein U5K79_21760 [Cyclobacteriaceae bacterium]|nr:hypothetical protein [Cyclobacteriaceae bacterium]